MLSNLIRYHALEYLWSHGYADAAEEKGVDGWGFRGLPNNGIELIYKGSCIRLRKGIDPPFPTTIASKDFYQQALFEELDSGVETNLLVLFNLDKKLQYTGELRLLRPTGIVKRRKLVSIDWAKSVRFEGLDLGKTIQPTYAHDKELPLGTGQDESEEAKQKRTGTDDTKKW